MLPVLLIAPRVTPSVGERESKGVEGVPSIDRAASLEEQQTDDGTGEHAQSDGDTTSVGGDSAARRAAGGAGADGGAGEGEDRATKELCVHPLSEMNVTSRTVCCVRVVFLGV